MIFHELDFLSCANILPAIADRCHLNRHKGTARKPPTYRANEKRENHNAQKVLILPYSLKMADVFETTLVYPNFVYWLTKTCDSNESQKRQYFFDGHRGIQWCLRIDRHHETATPFLKFDDARIAVGLSRHRWHEGEDPTPMEVTGEYLLYDGSMRLLHVMHCNYTRPLEFDAPAKVDPKNMPLQNRLRIELLESHCDGPLIVVVKIHYKDHSFAMQQNSDIRRLRSSGLPEGMCYDVTFDIDGTLMKAHKLILAGHSRFFEKMLFQNKMLEVKRLDEGQPIVLKDIPADVFSVFLDYCYGDNHRITQLDVDQKIQLFQLSDRLLCNTLFKYLEQHLIRTVNEDSAMKLIVFIKDDERLRNLRDQCAKKLVDFFQTLTKEKILNIPANVLEILLSASK